MSNTEKKLSAALLLSLIGLASLPIAADYAFDGFLDVKGMLDSSLSIPGKGIGDSCWPILYENTTYPVCYGPDG